MKRISLFFIFLLFLLPAVHGQYMSFFGDSTWEYHITYITNPPEDYINYPPEEPSLLGVYCHTYVYHYRKNHWDFVWDCWLPDFPETGHLPYQPCLTEDTVTGRLYQGYLNASHICDMSLSLGDTFYYNFFYQDVSYDWAMLVDSIKYLSGRKNIFLSLLDHIDDYFFGNNPPIQNNKFSIRFIEGIGTTIGFHPLMQSYLSLLLCVYKDDSLVYMADENLGCDQTCVGLEEYMHTYMNLYPNPASSYIILDMGTGEEMDGNVIITDVMGRVCLQQHVAGASNLISVADFPKGMYFLTYINDKKKVSRKFIKE
ncbi:MAG: T9SS type A sorting domain-containing protein [Bacteroidales bacterium]|nr:T9SS type A sorting domain-containing protein [Bacteroidales bacterium]